MKKSRKAVQVPNAPVIGPYSLGVQVSAGVPLLYISGQLPIDPSNGQMVEGDITLKAERVFENIKAVLAAGQSSLEKVIRLEIFCTDLRDFAAINAVCERYLSATDPLPARQTVQVAALPKGAAIEISCIATYDEN